MDVDSFNPTVAVDETYPECTAFPAIMRAISNSNEGVFPAVHRPTITSNQKEVSSLPSAGVEKERR